MAEKMNITLLSFLFGRTVLITQSCLSTTFGKLAGKGLPSKRFGVLMIPNRMVKAIGQNIWKRLHYQILGSWHHINTYLGDGIGEELC